MNDATPDLGEPCPVGHPSGRIWQPPASVKQARARVLWQMDNLEDSCRIGLDVGYSLRCLDEVVADYCAMVVGELWTPPNAGSRSPSTRGCTRSASWARAERAATDTGRHAPSTSPTRPTTHVTLITNGKHRRSQVHLLIGWLSSGPCPDG